MKNYPEEIRKQIQECQSHRLDDPAKVIASARILRTYAKEQKDTGLLAHADYYMANASYVLNDQKSCLHYLKRAIDGFEKTDNQEDLGFCYNMMGLVYTRNGNAAAAITAYLKALRIAEEQHIAILGAYAEINCADLCMELENEKEALHYLQLCEAYLDRCRDNPRTPFIYIVASSEAALTARNLKDMDEYNRQTVILNEILKEHPEDADDINVQLLNLISDETENKKERDAHIARLWDKLKEEPEFLDYHNEIVRLMHILYETDNYAVLDDLIDRLNREKGTLPLGMQTTISSFCIAYYAKLHKEDLLEKELVKYHESAEKLSHERENSILSLLSASMDLAVSRRTNQLLEKAADTDALTDHPNRRAFNARADQWFDEAKSGGHLFGLEMLDIDNFKHVNDTYGHTVGDDALIAVARALQKLDGRKIWSARYGGDEFVVLFHDCTDAEIRNYMHEMQKNIREEQTLNSLPSFTISQGAINTVPRALNRIWDFNYGADAALYQVKKRGKNMCLLIHEIEDLNNPDVEIMKTEEQ